MGKIVLLDDLTINQIAAGEVIERPASAIKELVENSIDAGAKNITIDIKNGGISYIRVTDDGSGIMPDDMEIAFERHATSKIRRADDLQEVKSMGFRGEALASIAAIAKVELVSKTADSDIGYKVVVQGGDIVDKHEEGASKGTSITVRELFYNTPVRYKFLKKDFTESGYIEDEVTKIALANPNVSIKLINAGKTILQTNGSGKLEDCIYAIFGKEVFENIIATDYTYEGMHITGVVGKPIISRSNRTNQIFFVNKRHIKDKTLTSAAEQGFKGLVTIGKHGFLILNIDMDQKEVDVNVHPTKLEVRFQREQDVFKAVYHAIKETLLKADLVSSPDKDYSDLTPNDMLKEIKNKDRIEAWGLNKTFMNSKVSSEAEKISSGVASIQKVEEKIEDPISKIPEEEIKIEEKIDTNPSLMEEPQEYKLNDISKTEDKLNQEDISDLYKEEAKSEDIVNNSETIEIENNAAVLETNEIANDAEVPENEEKPQFEEMYKKIFGRDIEEAKQEYKEKGAEEILVSSPINGNEISIFDDEESNQSSKPYKFIGIAFNTYIILSINNDMYILDQHAAHERIMYEKVKENYYKDEEKDSQLMLMPDIINLNNKEMGIFRDNSEMFYKAGFMVEEFGENTVKLAGVPEFCMDLDTKELFLETLDEINTVARTAKQELEDKFLATVACKAAVKANMALNKEEVDSLMEKLLKLPNPFSCPHGRPTVIKMSKTDIEKKFSRRQ